MKKIKESMSASGASEDEVKEFEKGAQTFAKRVVGNFKDYEFLIGNSMDPDAMSVICRPRCQCFHKLTRSQGCSPQLPRGRCHPLRYSLEARPQGHQGVSDLAVIERKGVRQGR